MSLININNLTFSYQNSFDYIFKDVSFSIDTDWKLGFTGRNGRGKTTFLKLLLGKYDYSGSISHSVKFDYFPFEVENIQDDTIETINSIVPDLQQWILQKELNLLEVDYECLYRPFKTLSNGEQTKVLLAALFLKQDNFLLIDEPTNHLDINARRIVSEYLSKKKSYILVSHDRDFLDNCVDHILYITKTGIEIQKGNFSSWFLNKQRQDDFEIAQNEKLLSEIQRLKTAARQKSDWSYKTEKEKSGAADKGFIGHKAAKVMKTSKVLQNRQEKAIEQKGTLLKNIETAKELKIVPLKHNANRLVDIKDLSITYGQATVFSNLNLTINHGDRICLSGKNGCGKSSLLKLLTGESIQYFGEFNIASNLKISYVCQDTSYLMGNLKDYALQHQIDESLFKAVLAKLDFSATQFLKDMREFSSGQKKKVLIAKSLCQSAHLYIWDEPLNYIDVLSRIQIEQLLLTYQPTMLFVEHDSAFINNIATSIIEM